MFGESKVDVHGFIREIKDIEVDSKDNSEDHCNVISYKPTVYSDSSINAGPLLFSEQKAVYFAQDYIQDLFAPSSGLSLKIAFCLKVAEELGRAASSSSVVPYLPRLPILPSKTRTLKKQGENKENIEGPQDATENSASSSAPARDLSLRALKISLGGTLLSVFKLPGLLIEEQSLR
eukprot:bmy_08542T0